MNTAGTMPFANVLAIAAIVLLRKTRRANNYGTTKKRGTHGLICISKINAREITKYLNLKTSNIK